MSFDWQSHIPGRIRSGKPYTPGEQRNTRDWIKLNTNEFPFPPSPAVAKAVAGAVEDLRLYPEPSARQLREAVASRYGVEAQQVVVFNGCDDALNCCIRGFVEPGERVGFLNPSYSLYRTLLANHGAEGVPIEYRPGFEFPETELAEAEVRQLLITSPNAPSGRPFSREQFCGMMESQPKAVIVLDETYADFADWTAIEYMREYPNLIVVRSFSKTYGLAGLRTGYAIAHREAVAALNQIRDVYNVNRLSQAGALAAFEDTEYYAEKHAELKRVKAAFEQFLEKELGWRSIPSATNFVCCYPKADDRESAQAAQALYDFLVEHRVLVRYFSNHPLVESALRISIGTAEAMDIVQNLLKSWAIQE